MIEYNIMQLLQNKDPFDMLFSINYTTEKDDVVTVYSTPGSAPSIYEGVLTYDNFQIVVKSSDFDKATEIAYDIQDTLHKLQNVVMQIQLKTKTFPIRVYFIRALHEPALLGVNDDYVMEYSLNFEAKLIRVQDA
ncbi:minor capsid protein [Staphylococcus capitis]|uniref:minor capsid protein n=1 Tax=Staphylococcus capitis TaxID=29388 RepID=UPI00145BA77D|nr:minor capsid protein [Staphylococcus capitis]NMK90584.1 minor capsid protein [Staphylococcus capitis]NMK92077.1 minor capsid protein [Staphylococcus capitis]